MGPNTIASSAVLSIWRLCHTVTLWEPNTAPTQAVQLVTLKGHYLEVTPKQFSLLSLLPPLFTFIVLCECRVLMLQRVHSIAVAYFMHVLLSCSVLWTLYDPIYGVNFTICYAKNRAKFTKWPYSLTTHKSLSFFSVQTCILFGNMANYSMHYSALFAWHYQLAFCGR